MFSLSANVTWSTYHQELMNKEQTNTKLLIGVHNYYARALSLSLVRNFQRIEMNEPWFHIFFYSLEMLIIFCPKFYFIVQICGEINAISVYVSLWCDLAISRYGYGTMCMQSENKCKRAWYVDIRAYTFLSKIFSR